MTITVKQKSAEFNGNIIAYVDIWLGGCRVVIDKKKRAYINETLRKDGFEIGIIDHVPLNKIERYEITRKE